jgi:hypothetical protein
MFHSMRRLGLVAATVAAGLTLISGVSQALTISFTAQAFDPIVTTQPSTINTFYLGSGGIPSSGFGNNSTSALLVNYNTSGLPYYVDSVSYNTSSTPTKFVANGAAIPPTPVTLAATVAPIGGTVSPAAAPVLGGGGTTLSQAFALGEFQQGAVNGEFTYVQINNGSTVITGHDHTFTTGDNTTSPNPADLSNFNGTTITVHFKFIPGNPDFPTPPTNLGLGFSLSSAFAVQTSGQFADLAFRNTALAGNTIEAAAVVPEPGTLALFIGMGISGSGLLLRRRRR